MLRRIARLFVIKNRVEASFIIYALALGAVDRGLGYVEGIGGPFGWLLFAACLLAVVMGGAKILEATGRDVEERRRAAAEAAGSETAS